MRKLLTLFLALLAVQVDAEPMSNAERELKLRHLAKKRAARGWRHWRAQLPYDIHDTVQLIEGEIPRIQLPNIQPIQLPVPREFMPLMVAGAFAGAIVSIAIADQRNLRRLDRETAKKAAFRKAAPAVPAAAPRREISRAELAAEYEAWKRQKKKTHYLAEN